VLLFVRQQSIRIRQIWEGANNLRNLAWVAIPMICKLRLAVVWFTTSRAIPVDQQEDHVGLKEESRAVLSPRIET
jgi:hypothetical protein